jgi:hypothetical protein
VPYTAQVSDLKGEPELASGRASVPQGQQKGAVQTVHLHGGAKLEGRGGAIEGRDKEDIVPSTPQAGKNAGESGEVSGTQGHGATEGAGPHSPNKSKVAQAEGIPVSTQPTYKDEMKKGGY